MHTVQNTKKNSTFEDKHKSILLQKYVVPFSSPKQAWAPAQDSELAVELDIKLHAFVRFHDLLSMMISSLVLEHAYKNADRR
jgi:hypothetical protein